MSWNGPAQSFLIDDGSCCGGGRGSGGLGTVARCPLPAAHTGSPGSPAESLCRPRWQGCQPQHPRSPCPSGKGLREQGVREGGSPLSPHQRPRGGTCPCAPRPLEGQGRPAGLVCHLDSVGPPFVCLGLSLPGWPMGPLDDTSDMVPLCLWEVTYSFKQWVLGTCDKSSLVQGTGDPADGRGRGACRRPAEWGGDMVWLLQKSLWFLVAA